MKQTEKQKEMHAVQVHTHIHTQRQVMQRETQLLLLKRKPVAYTSTSFCSTFSLFFSIYFPSHHSILYLSCLWSFSCTSRKSAYWQTNDTHRHKFSNNLLHNTIGGFKAINSPANIHLSRHMLWGQISPYTVVQQNIWMKQITLRIMTKLVFICTPPVNPGRFLQRTDQPWPQFDHI